MERAQLGANRAQGKETGWGGPGDGRLAAGYLALHPACPLGRLESLGFSCPSSTRAAGGWKC